MGIMTFVVGFLYTFVVIYFFSFKLSMQSRNGKLPLDAFAIVKSTFSSISFNFGNVTPRSCDPIANV